MKIPQLILIIFISLHISTTSTAQTNNEHQTLSIGIYSDKGVGKPGQEIEYADDLMVMLRALDPVNRVMLINSKMIKKGILERIDVVIFPGGSGRKQSESLGEKGRKKVKDFIKKGGGYVGICAGAYLAQSYDSRDSKLCLSISNAQVYRNAKYWDRGEGLSKVHVTNQGQMLFPEFDGKQNLYIFYSNGPLLVQNNNGKRKYNDLMKFKSNIYHNRPESKGDSLNKTFLLIEKNRKGTVILVSGHPEATPGLRWVLPRLTRIAGKRSMVHYPERFVNLYKYRNEIIFNDKWKKMESIYLKKLFYDDSSDHDKINAMNKLRKMGSRKFRDKLKELLKDDSAEVRKTTAKTIMFYDHFSALSKLKEVYKKEIIFDVKTIIKEAIDYLSTEGVN